MRRFIRSCLFAFLLAGLPPGARGDSLDEQLAIIGKSGPQGTGAEAARKACDAVTSAGTAALPRILAAMDTKNPLAANWYRVAFDSIVERELARPQPKLPIEQLRQFVHQSSHSGRARRLALALCEQLQPGYSQTLLAGMLDDAEFRADAVELTLTSAAKALDSGDKPAAIRQLQAAFEHARDGQQTLRAADRLAELGTPPDVAAHLGLVVDWWLLGPFDAPGFSGFAATFTPEQQVDLAAEYAGQDGHSIRWQRHHAADRMGLVNLVQAVAPAKEAVGYAYTELNASTEMTGQLRAGADDNCTVWLNGEKVLSRSQWLNGHRLDRFVAPVNLKAGRNTVLVKICQGPQHKDPQVPNNWSLQLRFCDADGKGLPLQNLLPPAGESRP